MIEKASSTAAYGGAISAVASGTDMGVKLAFGLTPSEWSVVGIIGGLAIGLIGLLINAYFQHQRLQLDRRALGNKPPA